MTKILLAEDDVNLAETLAYNLRREGYDTALARTGLQAIVASRAEHPDLILLDLMLPEVDGFEVCRTVRAESAVPIIMLTARDSEMDSVIGLEVGADDYVSKPFRLRELLARIRAQLRRAHMDGYTEPRHTLSHEGLEVRVEARTASCDGSPLHLLPREFDLLAYFMAHPGRVLTRSKLLEAVWGDDYSGDARTVDVHVRRLRSKIEADPANPCFIRTVHGVGYAFGDMGQG
jgi:two-component system response regulator RegX3